MNPTENWYVMVLDVMKWENVRTSSHFKTPLFLDRSSIHGIDLFILWLRLQSMDGSKIFHRFLHSFVRFVF